MSGVAIVSRQRARASVIALARAGSRRAAMNAVELRRFLVVEGFVGPAGFGEHCGDRLLAESPDDRVLLDGGDDGGEEEFVL